MDIIDKIGGFLIGICLFVIALLFVAHRQEIGKLQSDMLRMETQHAIQMEALIQRIQSFEMTVTGKIESQVSPPSWVLKGKK